MSEGAPSKRILVNDLSRGWAANNADVAAAVNDVLTSGWYVWGPHHEAFQRELADFCGTGWALGAASGTDALVLALQSVGVGRGSEVVLAPNAGGYAASACAMVGAVPVYADVDPVTHLITADTVATVLDPATSAVVVTHLYGNVAEVAEIVEVCRPVGVKVVEDCAQSLGGWAGSVRAGAVGDAAATSFYPTKNLGGFGDGGAVLTSDAEVAARVAALRQYGWQGKYRVAVPDGRNSRLDEVQAAVLRVGLPLLDSLNARRQRIVAEYTAAVTGTGLRMVTGASQETVGHLAVVETETAAEQVRLLDHLANCGVGTDVHYPMLDVHQLGLPSPARPTRVPVAKRVTSRVVTVPCYPDLSDGEVSQVANALAGFGDV